MTDACLEVDQRLAGIRGGNAKRGRSSEYIHVKEGPHRCLEEVVSEVKEGERNLEAFPLLLAVHVWTRHMLHRRVFFCINDEAAKSALINMSSSAPSMMVLK